MRCIWMCPSRLPLDAISPLSDCCLFVNRRQLHPLTPSCRSNSGVWNERRTRRREPAGVGLGGTACPLPGLTTVSFGRTHDQMHPRPELSGCKFSPSFLSRRSYRCVARSRAGAVTGVAPQWCLIAPPCLSKPLILPVCQPVTYDRPVVEAWTCRKRMSSKRGTLFEERI